MKIEKSLFTLFYPPQFNIRERLFDLEKHYSDFQKPFTLIPVPENAPPEIPRIITITENDHSRLTYTGVNVQLETRFDDDFTHNIDLCTEYIEKKCIDIVDSLNVIAQQPDSAIRFYYSGLTFVISYGEEDGIKNPVSYINDKFLKCHTDYPMEEVQFRIALNKDSKYYINLTLQSSRIYHGNPDERGSIVGLCFDDRLQLVLDINDKLAFNQEKGYLSDKKDVHHIICITGQIIKDRIDEFVKNGVITNV